MDMIYYQIGGVQISWREGKIPLVQDEYMSQYIVSKDKWNPAEDTVVYESALCSFEHYQNAKLLHKNETYELFDAGKGHLLIYHWAACRFGFGYWLEDLRKQDRIICYFNPDMEKQIPLSAVRFFSCAGLHSKLLQRGAFILHASYVNWRGMAIVFTAPSGIGKSTQAEFWRRYMGAEIINGDRALLRQRDGVWYSYGYPCCGSSGICVNRTLPLAMVVILEQGAQNRIVHMTNSQKIQMLVSGTEVFLWDESEINRAFQLAEELVNKVPIIKLICRPDTGAVDVLRSYLEGNLYGNDI